MSLMDSLATMPFAVTDRRRLRNMRETSDAAEPTHKRFRGEVVHGACTLKFVDQEPRLPNLNGGGPVVLFTNQNSWDRPANSVAKNPRGGDCRFAELEAEMLAWRAMEVQMEAHQGRRLEQKLQLERQRLQEANALSHAELSTFKEQLDATRRESVNLEKDCVMLKAQMDVAFENLANLDHKDAGLAKEHAETGLALTSQKRSLQEATDNWHRLCSQAAALQKELAAKEKQLSATELSIAGKAVSQLDGLKRLREQLDADISATEIGTMSDSQAVARAARNVLSNLALSTRQEEEAAARHEMEIIIHDELRQNIERQRGQCAKLCEQAAQAEEVVSIEASRFSRLEARMTTLRAERRELEISNAQSCCDIAVAAFKTKMESLTQISSVRIKLEGDVTLCSARLQNLFDERLLNLRQLRDIRVKVVDLDQTLQAIRCDYWQLVQAHHFRIDCKAEMAIVEDLDGQFLESLDHVHMHVASLKKQLKFLKCSYLSVFCTNVEAIMLGYLRLVELVRFATAAPVVRSGVTRVLPAACSSYAFPMQKRAMPANGSVCGLIRDGPLMRASRLQAHSTMDPSERLLLLCGCKMLRSHFHHLDLSSVPAASLSKAEVLQALASLPSLLSLTYPASGWRDPTELRLFKSCFEAKGVACHGVRSLGGP